MRVLVTGGCGFVGSHLCTALAARGDDVTVLDNLSTGKRSNLVAGARLVEGSVADPHALANAMEGAEGVFHLAAAASVQLCNESWRESHVTNQTGTVTVLEAARDAGRVPVVYTSSAAIYGNVEVVPILETCLPAPTSAYGVDKLGSELHSNVGQTLHGLRTVGLRPFNIYGPGQDPHSPYSGVITVFADRIGRGAPFIVNGDGKQTRDFIYVGDAVRFFLAAMSLENTAPSVYNVATGIQTSLLELIAALSQVTGRKPVFSHGPARDGDIRNSCGSTVQAKSDLGISARTSLLEGLHRTFEYQSNP
ncbi:epimerase [Sulfitobacter sp. SK012]|uniref:NAD-dependent epimerase/dehydratase family protein n=1 Tax=Sulfitobacter sp. SK012 TaxID=1389005 RepID=UPI000E0C1A6A|nr:NAD-dependent epimerase/dehydratase family protein [Sulfitobacter sp. SK012]AXI47271.1 epimerase [Sulfitobacter sp. SK012]